MDDERLLAALRDDGSAQDEKGGEHRGSSGGDRVDHTASSDDESESDEPQRSRTASVSSAGQWSCDKQTNDKNNDETIETVRLTRQVAQLMIATV